jgi:butyrate kinase
LSFKILVVNPGSTSTKLAIFEDGRSIAAETISHDAATIAQFASLMDQLPMRLAIVKDFLYRHSVSMADLSAIACRGGLLRPLPSGTYRVDEQMVSTCVQSGCVYRIRAVKGIKCTGVHRGPSRGG